MLRRSEVPLLDSDPVLFEAPPDWLVPDLARALREGPEERSSLRSLLDRPEAQSWAWRLAGGRARRTKGRAARPREAQAVRAIRQE
jgi:hypothetical protein